MGCVQSQGPRWGGACAKSPSAPLPRHRASSLCSLPAVLLFWCIPRTPCTNKYRRNSSCVCRFVLRSAIIGELDKEVDARVDLSSVRAEPLKPVLH